VRDVVADGGGDLGERAHGRKTPEPAATGNRRVVLSVELRIWRRECAVGGRVHSPPHWLKAAPSPVAADRVTESGILELTPPPASDLRPSCVVGNH
jgi:hypothetical protein